MDKQRDIKYLVTAYLTGGLEPEARCELEAWLAEEGNREVFERICNGKGMARKMRRMQVFDEREAWRRLEGRMEQRGSGLKEAGGPEKKGGVGRRMAKEGVRHVAWRRYWIAASMLPLLVVGVVLWEEIRKEEVGAVGVMVQPVAGNAGGDVKQGVRMVLASGEVVDLQKEGAFTMETSEGIQVENTGGKVTLKVKEQPVGEVIRWHTVETPRGGEYHVELPDGTQVWLNAASSLRFPSSFEGSRREVHLTGEGYFEVAHDRSSPFGVTVAGTRVEVLGTKFNVRAYSASGYATTLVEGKVRVARGTEDKGQAVMLAPGQEAVFAAGGLAVNKANMDEALSWLNNAFVFDNAPLEQIMAELERWYDTHVTFLRNEMRSERFSIEMPRYDTLEETLKALERTKSIHFEVGGEDVIIK